MSGMLNKIWSNDSLLNNTYTHGLIDEAMNNPDKPLVYKEEELSKGELSKRKVATFFEKVGLTLSLLVPGLRGRIIQAFTTVQALKDSTIVKMHKQGMKSLEDYQQGIKNLRDKEVKADLRHLDASLAQIIREIHENDSSKQEKSALLQAQRKELEKLETQKGDIPQKLELIASYLKAKDGFERSLQQKLDSRPRLFNRKTDADIYAEAAKEQHYEDLMALEKTLQKSRIPTAGLVEYNDHLILAFNALPEKIENLQQSIPLLEGEIASLESQLKPLLEEKTKIEKKKESLSKWLSQKPESPSEPVDEKPEARSQEQYAGKEPVEAADATHLEASAVNLPAKEQMLQDIKTFIHADVETVWKGLFDKFDPAIVKSWSCDPEGNFKLELNTPMRAWIPSKDDAGKQDPSSGVVLLLGIDDNGKETGELTGKMDRENKDMKFAAGFNFFVKPDDTRANPGYINLTNIQYNDQNDIRIITNKDLKKDYGRFLRPVVAHFARNYGTVDNNYVLIVNKQRSLSNMVANWNEAAEVVENEKQRLGVK